MTFPPTTIPEVAMTRAVMPADDPAATHPAHVEGESPASIARRLYAAGRRAAFVTCTDAQLCIEIVRVLTDAGLRIGETLDRDPDALPAVREALWRLCDAAIADPFDPEHVAAVQAESRGCALRMGGAPATEAAE